MNIKFNHCLACGFPMDKIQDYGGFNKNNSWCSNCCYENGEHKPFETLIEEMSKFLLTKEGEQTSEIKFKSIEQSREFAIKYLKKQPAFNKQ